MTINKLFFTLNQLIKLMIDAYDETIEINTIDAFEYYDRLVDYIDKIYKTTYADLVMNDEIENMLDEFTNAKDYEPAERTYDLACQKYPLVKENVYLNPKFRYVKSFYVFDLLFDEMLQRSEGFPNITTEEIKEKLITKFPECKDLILMELSDDIPDEYDDVWLIPQDIILREDYHSLFNELKDMFKQ